MLSDDTIFELESLADCLGPDNFKAVKFELQALIKFVKEQCSQPVVIPDKGTLNEVRAYGKTLTLWFGEDGKWYESKQHEQDGLPFDEFSVK